MPPPARSTEYERALALLLERINYERTPPGADPEQVFKLDRMRALLERLENPHDGLPIVHIAGTKGKGSTATMIAGALSAAGHRTGLFTSPHLQRLEERMAVDGVPCSAGQLVKLVERLRAPVEALDRMPGPGPTYFELTTALALLHFRRARVDAAVLEVGMGGRLDSTNVCQPAITVVTSISLDHTRQLGDTQAAIAREKAGIIKAGVPVISGVTNEEARVAIRTRCRELAAPLVESGVDFEFAYHPPPALERRHMAATFDYQWRAQDKRFAYRSVRLGLLGAHQAANGAVAISTLEALRRQGWSIPRRAIRDGVAQARCPARVEVIARRPTIVIDAAHNVASIKALVETLAESVGGGPRVLVLAVSRDKDAAGMLAVAAAQFDRIVLTEYRTNPRSVPAGELAAIASRAAGDRPVAIEVWPEIPAAWDAARRDVPPGGLICVAGSFFVAAEMRQEIERRSTASERAATLEMV